MFELERLKKILRYLLLILLCATCALALTVATYFYSYVDDFAYWAAWSVNRGLPLSWAIEMHNHVVESSAPSPYPFNFQALNFSLDLIFWTTVLLLSSSLYVYRTRMHAKNRLNEAAARA
jgi:heme/copper-type cytochrome/quinol oxidase subunit 3